MNIIGVEHISVNTNDIQKSLAFYQGILGLNLWKLWTVVILSFNIWHFRMDEGWSCSIIMEMLRKYPMVKATPGCGIWHLK